jgi:hypothetical protein
VVWGLKPLRRAPTDAQLARLIEERVPALDDRLATALDAVAVALQRGGPPPLLLGPLVEDTARRVDVIALDDIVPRERLRRGGFKAGAAGVTLAVLAIMAREPARQSLDAASLALFPERIRLEVLPGDTRLVQGAPLTIQARLAGNRAPVGARVEISEGDRVRTAGMLAGSGGEFRLPMSQVVSDFQYRVLAGSIASRMYRVTVARPPHVVRIDADYAFPVSLGLPHRTETDGGDVYAPAGTDVTLHVFTDRPIAAGQLSLASGQSIPLTARADAQLTATLKVLEDGSYRVALRDRDGLTDQQTEYLFARSRTVRRCYRKARQRSVTRLEEVDIEAKPRTTWIDRMELVYAVRGQSEK